MAKKRTAPSQRKLLRVRKSLQNSFCFRTIRSDGVEEKQYDARKPRTIVPFNANQNSKIHTFGDRRTRVGHRAPHHRPSGQAGGHVGGRSGGHGGGHDAGHVGGHDGGHDGGCLDSLVDGDLRYRVAASAPRLPPAGIGRGI